jgi:hypothetical protein
MPTFRVNSGTVQTKKTARGRSLGNPIERVCTPFCTEDRRSSSSAGVRNLGGDATRRGRLTFRPLIETPSRIAALRIDSGDRPVFIAIAFNPGLCHRDHLTTGSEGSAVRFRGGHQNFVSITLFSQKAPWRQIKTARVDKLFGALFSHALSWPVVAVGHRHDVRPSCDMDGNGEVNFNGTNRFTIF